MNAEKISTKCPHARERPSAYNQLGKSFRSVLETRLTLLCAIVYMAALVTRLGCKVDDAEQRDRYIMRHLGELDDRFDELKSECNKNRDTIRRLKDEVKDLKRRSSESEGVKAGKRFQEPRKRARRA